MVKLYQTDLRIQGQEPGLQIDNSALSIALHPNSGHLDQITLKSKADFPFITDWKPMGHALESGYLCSSPSMDAHG